MSQTYTEAALRKTKINWIDDSNVRQIQPTEPNPLQLVPGEKTMSFIYDTYDAKMYTNELHISMIQSR